MDKNFKVRFCCSIILLIIAGICLPFFNSLPFKIFFALFAFIAEIELLSFFKKKTNILNIILAILETAFLVFGSIFIFRNDFLHISMLILGVCGYDVFAYLFGKALGGQIFSKTKPFPHISKNKTWEGTFMGLVSSFFLTSLLMTLTNCTDYIFLTSGIFALIGDLAESSLKRCFKVKDSNEIIIKTKLFQTIELLVGGGEGHGGYLDRIDSIAFTATILLLFSIL